ncbi:predicted protein, partial [Thalassiosira pseudonana CCMP1335]
WCGKVFYPAVAASSGVKIVVMLLEKDGTLFSRLSVCRQSETAEVPLHHHRLSQPPPTTPVPVSSSRMFNNAEETSSLFSDEQLKSDHIVHEVPMRQRRAPKTTQFGPKRPRDETEKAKPALEWTKAIIICLALSSGFVSFVWVRRSRHFLRKSSDYKKIDRCNLASYPLYKIEEVKELSLSGCTGVILPEDTEVWSRFKSLKKLDLNNSSLTELPDEMDVLAPSLEILFLSENKFDAIPDVIGKLSHLRVLSLRGNQLSELSSSNLPASSLVWLILTNNQIKRISADIGQLKGLQKLMLSHNEIKTVPSELGDCKMLELVRLANNNINSMPTEILSLPKLAWMSLSGNPMSHSPKSSEKVIKEKDIIIDHKHVLGKGASGVVYRGTYQDKQVAVKIFKEQSKGSDGNAEDEMAINGLINNPLAISAIGVIESKGAPGTYGGLVMNLLSGTYSLGKVPSFDTVTRDAVGVSHSDVYLHNILKDDEGVSRLSDWGASYVYDRNNAQMAPMIERIEVLAFGRLIQNLFDWHLNIAIPDSTESVSYLESMRKSKLEAGSFRDLIAEILQPLQEDRPTFKMIKERLTAMPEFEEAIASTNSKGHLT